ncbi:ABC transporter ATP-binding protein [Granulosicoccus sp. 3-233]|uniref:ABC transporter ATP-binding protein n=1 Tax=Granulosicoccus sp. 3-233 TaxID=3417969 RepID=UPI003D354FEA
MSDRKGHRPTSVRQTVPGLRRVLVRFSPYLREHRVLLAGSTLALVLATLVRLLEPWPLKYIIDQVVPSMLGIPVMNGQAWFSGLGAGELLAWCCIAVVVIVALKAAFEYMATVGFALIGNRVLTDIRRDLFDHLQRLSLSFHTRVRTGDLTMRLISDVGMLKETMVTAALPLAVSLLMLVGMITVMLMLNWQLTLLALLPLPLLCLNTRRIGRKIQMISRKQRKREGDMASIAAESLAGIRTVQAFTLEERVAEGFQGKNRKSLKEGVQAKKLAAAMERSVDLLLAIGMAIVLWFGTLQIQAGRLSPGDLLVFITYLKNTFRPVRHYAKYSSRLAKATAAGERVIELLDEVPEVRNGRAAERAPSFSGRVQFDHVSFRYGRNALPVLDDFSLSIDPGTRVAITGASGVGKSTFISLVLRFYDPEQGRVLLDGLNIRDFELTSLRKRIALVPQENLLFQTSVRENIALGAEGEVTDEQIEAAARLANAHEFIMAMPDGYATVVSERGTSLSAGQRQRIGIARAALRDCPIVLLDEPTVGLDRNSEAVVIDAIERICTGRTSFLITHDLKLASCCERIVCLSREGIPEDGGHQELVLRGGQYARLWASSESSEQRQGKMHAVTR